MKNLLIKVSIAFLTLGGLITYTACHKTNTAPTVTSETSNGGNSIKSNLQRTSVEYSGEQIFRGIFFISGSFKNEIASYKNVDLYTGLSADQQTSLTQLQSRIITAMTTLDRDCFNRFATEIKSGSAARADKAMDDIATTMVTATSTMPEYSQYGMLDANENFITKNSTKYQDVTTNKLITQNPDLLSKNSLSRQQCVGTTFAVAVVFYFAAAVHNTAAITVNAAIAADAAIAIYLAIWKYKYCWSGSAAFLQPKSEYPASYRELYSLQYENFVNDIASVYQ